MIIKTRKNCGLSTVGAVVSGLIISTGLLAYTQFLSVSQRNIITQQNKLSAQAYAAELLEFFRSLTPTQMQNYMIARGFPYCEEINLLDREATSYQQATVILRPDAIAALPQTILDRTSLDQQPNRSYRVQIVNMRTENAKLLSPMQNYCGQVTPVSLSEDERIVVSVKVSWIPPGMTGAHNLELSTTIEEQVAELVCGGGAQKVANKCWYMASMPDMPCSDVCSAHGGYHTATKTFAGTDGSVAGCTEVAAAFGATQTAVDFSDTSAAPLGANVGSGCVLDDTSNAVYRLVSDFTNADGNWTNSGKRLCACKA